MNKECSDIKRVALVCPLGRLQTRMPVPPYGLAALAQYYQTYGANKDRVIFRVFDENGEGKDLVKEVLQWNPSFIGIGAMSLTKDRAIEFAQQIRQQRHQTIMIAGGVHFQIEPTEGLSSGLFDFICTGEGEEALLGLLDFYYFSGSRRQSLQSIPNLAYVDHNGTVIQTERRPLKDLDTLPFPDQELFNQSYYFRTRTVMPRIITKTANVLTSRGCPFRCSYCFNSFYGRHVRYRNIHSVVDYIVHLQKKYRVKHIGIMDDLFVMNKARVRDFCEMLIKHVPDIIWSCNGRPNLIREKDLSILELMRKSGCKLIAYGFESGSDEVLARIRGAGATVASNQQALDITYRAGIPVFGYFMCGIPGETEEQMEMTKAFIRKNFEKLHHFELFIYTPFPGSELAKEVERQGLLDGVTMNDLALNIFSQGTPRVFNTQVPAEKILKFRRDLKRKVMGKYALKDKIHWLISEGMDNPLRTFRRLMALYWRA